MTEDSWDEPSTTIGEPDSIPAPVAVIPPPVPWWQRWFWFPVKLGVGALLMQTPAGAIAVAGWLQRCVQRAVFRSWWRRGRGRLGTFEEFMAEEPMLLDFRRMPNWVVDQENRLKAGGVGAGVGVGGNRGFWARYFGSLASNVWRGIQSLSNVAILTMPGAALWWFGWWGGWQNSFHKGYEHALVGPLISWFGILLFVAAMFYVPMAAARQAATGRWKSFWEGRTVWTLVRVSWWQSACVAVAHAVANVIVMGLKSWPQFLPQARVAALAQRGLDPTEAYHQGIEKVDWSELTEAQAVQILNLHFLGSALAVLAILLVLKRLVAWMYSGAVLRAVRRRVLGEEHLADSEWRILNTLGLLQVGDPPVRAFLVRAIAWAGTKAGRVVSAGVVFLSWFAFVSAIYVSEFFSHHPGVGWLNQPLVQVPWFRYVPPTLENPAPSLLAAAVLVGIACAIRAWRRRGAARRGATMDG
ncbi:MAG: hypothetical protein AB7J34_06005 [Limisphaerales bacterium]